MNKLYYGGDFMKRYTGKSKKYTKNKKKDYRIYKVYISAILFVLIISLSSMKISFAQSFRNYITYSLRNNADFAAIADKTGKFAVECINYYKKSDNQEMKDGGQK